jgi:protein PhnA
MARKDKDYDYTQDYNYDYNEDAENETESEVALVFKDSNGTILAAGDSVKLIKDLKVKGTSINLKRGTIVKKIRLTDNEEEIEGKVDGEGILVLKTCFLQKVTS